MAARGVEQHAAGDEGGEFGPGEACGGDRGEVGGPARREQVAAGSVAGAVRGPRGGEQARQFGIAGGALRAEQFVELGECGRGVAARELGDLGLLQPIGDHGVEGGLGEFVQPAEGFGADDGAGVHGELFRGGHEVEDRRLAQRGAQGGGEVACAAAGVEFGAGAGLGGGLQEAPTDEGDEAEARGERQEAEQGARGVRGGGDRRKLAAGWGAVVKQSSRWG